MANPPPRTPIDSRMPSAPFTPTLTARLNTLDSFNSKKRFRDSLSSPLCGSENYDSGYQSTVKQSAERVHGLEECEPHGFPLKRRRFKRTTWLKQFDKPIPDDVNDRFRDLRKLWDAPLSHYLSDNGNVSSVSIVLKFLGEDESTAKPWIVVFCHKAIASRVKRWFNEPPIKASYQDLPSFNLLVQERQPKLLAASLGDACGDRLDRPRVAKPTLCGKSVKIRDALHGSCATVGGVLKLTWTSGHWSLYCITTDHFNGLSIETCVLEDARATGPQDSDTENVGRIDYRRGGGDDEYEIIIDDSDVDEDEIRSTTTSINDPSNWSNDCSWTKIGHVVQRPEAHLSADRNSLDWVLFRFDDVLKYRENLYYDSTIRRKMVLPSSTAAWPGLGKDVSVIGRNGAVISGQIQRSPMMLLLPQNKSFQETYYLILQNGFRLKPGDSGAWVIDAFSGEVYGHVTASDGFNAVYVLPFNALLRQVKDCSGCHSIAFPTACDIDEITSRNQLSGKALRSSRHTPPSTMSPISSLPGNLLPHLGFGFDSPPENRNEERENDSGIAARNSFDEDHLSVNSSFLSSTPVYGIEPDSAHFVDSGYSSAHMPLVEELSQPPRESLS